MLVHLRLTVPSSLTSDVRRLLLEDGCGTNVVLHSGASLEPEGDLLECDVARESVNELLGQLDEIGVGEQGGILVSTPDSTPFAAAKELEEAAPGDPEDAVIWDSVLEEAEDGSVPTLSFQMFLTCAVILAAVAVVTDSAVLVVGAMVVGPEFASVAAACIGVVFGRWGLVRKALGLLLGSFTVAVAVVTVLALGLRLVGLLEVSDITAPRPQTDFIWQPDMWSFVVALTAGVVGALALSLGKTSAMVGVFISVTTVPAAGNLALGLALWERGEILGSLTQLGLNLAGLFLAATLFLTFQRFWWGRLSGFVERRFGAMR